MFLGYFTFSHIHFKSKGNIKNIRQDQHPVSHYAQTASPGHPRAGDRVVE